MLLTAVEFAKIIRDLRCDVRPDERRENPRAPARSRVDTVRVKSGAKLPVAESLRVRDISRNGLGLMSNEKPEDGARFMVLLPKTATESFVLLCEVARVTRVPGDAYSIGLQMVRRVTEQERAAFMRGSPDALATLLAVTSAETLAAAATSASSVVASAAPAAAA